MDRSKLVEIIASAPSGGPTGTVGNATANYIADALDAAGCLIAERQEVEGKPRARHAVHTPKPGDG